MQEIKKCLSCQKGLKGGRIDRKFCDSQCRASYHNNQRQDKEQMVRSINEILKKNWKILKILNPTGYSTVQKNFLDEQGYNFNYFTNVFKTKEGRVYYFCYDLGIAEVDSKNGLKINIVNWQQYMVNYQLPIAKGDFKKKDS